MCACDYGYSHISHAAQSPIIRCVLYVMCCVCMEENRVDRKKLILIWNMGMEHEFSEVNTKLTKCVVK